MAGAILEVAQRFVDELIARQNRRQLELVLPTKKVEENHHLHKETARR